jgi:hypothetical protein
MSSNYQRGKIYSIRSHNSDLIYIGSTTEKNLSRRMALHNLHYKAFKNGSPCKSTAVKVMDCGNAYIELVELYPCETRDELNRREGEIIRTSENTVNRCIAGRTKLEYRLDNKIRLSEEYKQYHIKNRVKRLEQMVKRRNDSKSNCQCGGLYTKGSKKAHFKTKKHIKFFTNLT